MCGGIVDRPRGVPATTMPLSRSAGFFERYYVCRATTGCLNRGFCMAAAMHTPASDAHLSAAIARLMLAHPMLAVNAFRTDNAADSDADAAVNGTNYIVRFVERVLYTDVVEHRRVATFGDSVFRAVAQESIPVNVDKPTWRLLVYHARDTDTQHLLFANNHAFLDGRAVVNFFEDLVLQLAHLPAAVEHVDTVFAAATAKKLPRATEDVVDLYNAPPLYAAKTILGLHVPHAVHRFYELYVDWSAPNLYVAPPLALLPFDGYNESAFRNVNVPPAQVAQLVAHCRGVGTTLTPYLAACTFKALDAALGPQSGPFTQRCELVIDGRRYYPALASKTRYGVFASTLSTYVFGDSVTSAALHLSRRLALGVLNRHGFYAAGMLRWVNIWEYFRQKVATRAARSTFEVSNVGLVKLEKGAWKVTDLIFSQGITSALMTLSVVSTADSGMNVMFGYHDKLDAAAMATFFREFEQLMARPV